MKKCIDNLTEFQEHLGKLVTFFSSLNDFIDIIHDGHALEFLNQVNNVTILDQNAAQETRSNAVLGRDTSKMWVWTVAFDISKIANPKQ